MSDGDGGDMDGGFGSDGHADHHGLADGIEHHAFDGHDHGHGHGHGDFHGLSHSGFHGFDHGFQSDVIAAILGGTAFASDHGHGHGHHGLHGGGVSGELGKGRKVFLPGLSVSPRVVQALAWPHGVFGSDCPTVRANPRKKLRELLEKAGMVDVGFSVRDVAPQDAIQDKLLDTTPFDDRVGNTPMPSGWFPNATGHTRVWTDFYQIGKRFCFIGPRVIDPKELDDGVYLAICGATWYFHQTMDFETRISLSVKCRRKWTKEGSEWRGLEDKVKAHRQLAVAASRDWLTWLLAYKPDRASIAARTRVQNIPLPEEGRRIPPPSTVPVTAFDGLRPGNAPGADGIDALSYPT